MKLWYKISVSQQDVDFLVRCYEIQAWSCLEGFRVDCVWVVMVSDQYIPISLAWCDWEPSCLIRINFPGKIHYLEEDNIGVFWLSGLRELVLLWIWFWMHDLFLCWSEALPRFLEVPKYGFFSSARCLWTRSNDRPGQEVKNVLWLLFPILNEWGSRRMRGGILLMYFLICTRKCSLQNIRQELWTPSLDYFSGSSSTCKG